ncbi:hypothetical protein [Ectobacillus panaciterrae]|nr:hypothetical protein [Ectobacillus panaciterrae]
MKKESYENKRKTTDKMNDEMKTIYNNLSNEKNEQPEPQPKDYDEIEY